MEVKKTIDKNKGVYSTVKFSSGPVRLWRITQNSIKVPTALNKQKSTSNFSSFCVGAWWELKKLMWSVEFVKPNDRNVITSMYITICVFVDC